MLPATRHSLPEWEVKLDGKVVGWLREKRIGKSSRPFYEAVCIHPVNGREFSLENSTDWDDRLAVLELFQTEPWQFNHHLPFGSRFEKPKAE